jgi:hypothetical protein
MGLAFLPLQLLCKAVPFPDPVKHSSLSSRTHSPSEASLLCCLSRRWEATATLQGLVWGLEVGPPILAAGATAASTTPAVFFVRRSLSMPGGVGCGRSRSSAGIYWGTPHHTPGRGSFTTPAVVVLGKQKTFGTSVRRGASWKRTKTLSRDKSPAILGV